MQWCYLPFNLLPGAALARVLDFDFKPALEADFLYLVEPCAMVVTQLTEVLNTTNHQSLFLFFFFSLFYPDLEQLSKDRFRHPNNMIPLDLPTVVKRIVVECISLRSTNLNDIVLAACHSSEFSAAVLMVLIKTLSSMLNFEEYTSATLY